MLLAGGHCVFARWNMGPDCAVIGVGFDSLGHVLHCDSLVFPSCEVTPLRALRAPEVCPHVVCTKMCQSVENPDVRQPYDTAFKQLMVTAAVCSLFLRAGVFPVCVTETQECHCCWNRLVDSAGKYQQRIQGESIVVTVVLSTLSLISLVCSSRE